MRRWFLSYNSQDLALMQALEAALKRREPGVGIFFAPMRIPTKPARHSNMKPATRSEMKPAMVPI